ncbi:MAG: transketolase [Spirochaetales bacterium]|nr:transketolase [Spirochaetales bacterium]
MRLTDAERDRLHDAAYAIRRYAIEMITYGTWGHIGGSFSMAEILAVLYFYSMSVFPDAPADERRDRVILSKAHASPALYAALAARGFYPVETIYRYCELDGLEGHTHITSAPGIEASGGPLGMGLSVCVGQALALRRKENPRARVYCILGDGETNEGNVWEAAMAAAHFRLDNLIAVVDYNKVLAKGFVWEEMSIEPFRAKWEAFGWKVIEVDGHDVDELAHAFHRARWVEPAGKPICVIAHTVKGMGVERTEFNYKWHTHAPDAATADAMLRELSRRYGKPEEGYSKIGGESAKETFYGGE